MIELSSVSKTYKGSLKPAVNDISITIKDSRVTGLLGPNGAGKTTLLKAILGIHFPDKGTITINGHSYEDYREIQRITGFVSENARFSEQYLVSELLWEQASIRYDAGSLKDLPVHAIKKAVKQFALEDVLEKKIKTLSKGYRQRLSFALAILHDPAILILDEPVSGLDPLQIVEMRKYINLLSETKTILLSTHLMQEAESLCSDIIIMHQGKMIATGSAESICSSVKAKTLEDAFIALVSEKDTDKDGKSRSEMKGVSK